MSIIAVMGTLDSKGEEHAFVAERIHELGKIPLLIDTGTGGPPTVSPDVTRDEVLALAGMSLPQGEAASDRGACVRVMAEAAPIALRKLFDQGCIDGVISLGGGGGTAIGTAAMRALPTGFPKLMVSTLASGNTAHYIGASDIVMFPSIVDVSGLNRLSRLLFTRAAGAICGMVSASPPASSSDKPLIVASMFGNTTTCVNDARRILEEQGYEVLVFHATGTGGKAMESIIASGLVAGVLDITTTEWADEYVGGVLGAGPTRLDAAALAGVPAIVVPGCLDMVNFGEPNTVPERFAGRTFYHHNPQVTLMRTNAEECAQLGKIIAEKVNRYSAPVTVMLPTRAISVISAPGGPFHDTDADHALFSAIRSTLRSDIPLISHDVEINDPAFARACAQHLLDNMQSHAKKTT